MSSILDDPAVRKAVFPLSVGFFHQAGELGLIGEDVELLDGTLVRKMSKSALHCWITRWLFRWLDASLPPHVHVRKEEPLTFETSEPEPDLAIVDGSADDYRAVHPSTANWVIEVAISTLEVDRQKAAIYATAGVLEYWIVQPEAGWVEVYRQPVGGAYSQMFTARPPARVESAVFPGMVVDLAELLRR